MSNHSCIPGTCQSDASRQDASHHIAPYTCDVPHPRRCLLLSCGISMLHSYNHSSRGTLHGRNRSYRVQDRSRFGLHKASFAASTYVHHALSTPLFLPTDYPSFFQSLFGKILPNHCLLNFLGCETDVCDLQQHEQVATHSCFISTHGTSLRLHSQRFCRFLRIHSLTLHLTGPCLTVHIYLQDRALRS